MVSIFLKLCLKKQKKEIIREEAAAETETIVPIPRIVSRPTKPAAINPDEKVMELARTLKGTKTQLAMLKAYADQIGVEIIR